MWKLRMTQVTLLAGFKVTKGNIIKCLPVKTFWIGYKVQSTTEIYGRFTLIFESEGFTRF